MTPILIKRAKSLAGIDEKNKEIWIKFMNTVEKLKICRKRKGDIL